MTISSKPKISEQIEQLFEPAARAARRGDADQIQRVLKRLRSLWNEAPKKTPAARKSDFETARGMTFAIEGLLGIILASAGSDARHSLLGRKYALPLLHALGRKAREPVSSDLGDSTDGSLSMGELAKAVGARPQNIGELVEAMRNCRLLEVANSGPARKVTITDIGVQALEAHQPGWQVTELEQEAHDAELQAEIRKIEESFQTLKQTRGEAVQITSLDRDPVRILSSDLDRLLNPKGHRTADAASKWLPVEVKWRGGSLAYDKPAHRNKLLVIDNKVSVREPHPKWLEQLEYKLPVIVVGHRVEADSGSEKHPSVEDVVAAFRVDSQS